MMKSTKRFVSMVIICMSCILMGALPVFAARTRANVKNEVANIRTGAGTQNQVVCQLTKGKQVTILSEALDNEGKKWYEVYFAYNDGTNEGYIREDLVTLETATQTSTALTATDTTPSTNTVAATTQAPANTMYVRVAAARVRGGAGTDAAVVTGLVKGSAVVKNGSANDKDGKEWSKVSFKDARTGKDTEGYIRSDLLTTDAASCGVTGASQTTATASTPVQAAPAQTDTASNVGKVMSSTLPVINVRGTASATGNLVTKVRQGTNMNITSETTGADGKKWYGVSFSYFGYNFTGYVRSDLVK
ncbi:MAG: SH3 domain-containing protein [Lachnospiraceae bacterium]|nr:SH3 domain-containing protein [Lachnospiraceae bacterium]